MLLVLINFSSVLAVILVIITYILHVCIIIYVCWYFYSYLDTNINIFEIIYFKNSRINHTLLWHHSKDFSFWKLVPAFTKDIESGYVISEAVPIKWIYENWLNLWVRNISVGCLHSPHVEASYPVWLALLSSGE